MTTISKADSYRIVQATDLLPDADGIAEHGFGLARKAGGELITLHIADKEVEVDPEKVLAKFAEASPGLDHKIVVRSAEEKAKKELMSSLEELRPDLLVVGTRQQKVRKTKLRGSVSEVAAMDAATSTLVVHLGQPGIITEEGEIRIRRVLLPVGDGEEARDAIGGLTAFLAQIEAEDVDIHLLRVGDGEILNYLRIPEKKGWRWHRETRDGLVPEVIGEVAEEKEIDLIAMASRGQDGFIDVFSGTHTQKVIRRVSKPVLVTPVRGS